MTDRDHLEWTERLSAHLSGDLDPATAGLVERHLRECPRCTETLAELERVVGIAHDAGDLEPPRDLWPAIAESIASIPAGSDTEVIELPTAAQRRPARGGPSRPRLAAAAVALIVVSAGGGWWAASAGTPTSQTSGPDPLGGFDAVIAASDDAGAPADLAAQLQVLEQLVAAARETLDPSTVLILERNLNTIETAIADSREALATDPGNAFLTQHLERMYRRKLVYLQEAVRVAEWAG
jgi:anti-sigma factor RsiW